MRSLPAEVDQEILSLLIQGVAYREISRRFGISTSTVARIAADARERNPDYDARARAEVNAHAVRRATLVAENTVLQAVDLFLRTGILNMQCKSCGHLLPIWLPTQEFFWNLANTGQAVISQCQNCRTPQSFTTREIAFQIAWMILPTNVHE